MASLSGEVMAKCVPIIVILGGTGTGKSKLGIEIAKRLGSEIISADSMQVYKGLDILTNKVTEEEKCGVVHHLLDFVSPLKTFSVVDFRNQAIPIIDRLLKNGHPPVIVGGTNYYIESILWKILVANSKSTSDDLTRENNNGSESLAFRLGLRPFSMSFKRKADDESSIPFDFREKVSLMVREILVMAEYPHKLFGYLQENLADCKEENCTVLGTLFGALVAKGNSARSMQMLLYLKSSLPETSCANCPAAECLPDIIDLNVDSIKVLLELDNSIPESDRDMIVLLRSMKEKKDADLPGLAESLQSALKKLKEVFRPRVESLVNRLGPAARMEVDVEAVPSPQLHEFLQQVDPRRAECLHPNDQRKIIRSLEIWAHTGRGHSEILDEQKRNGSLLGGPLRYKNIVILWMTCDKDVLNKRLDKRVDEMLDRGLVKELLTFYAQYQSKEEDFTKGIFQSIGFKEFKEFLLLNEEQKAGPEGEKKLREGIETLRLVTKRYVKAQTKWIRNRFLTCPDREVPPVYKLDTTNVDRWAETVYDPAIDIVLSRLEGRTAKLEPVAMESNITAIEELTRKTGLFHCDTCDRAFVGEMQWEEHMKSLRHKKMVKKKKRVTGDYV